MEYYSKEPVTICDQFPKLMIAPYFLMPLLFFFQCVSEADFPECHSREPF